MKVPRVSRDWTPAVLSLARFVCDPPGLENWGLVAPDPGRRKVGARMASACEAEAAALDGVTLVTVRGEIDMASGSALTAALTKVDASARLEVDLSAVDFMDSSGLHIILVKAGEMRQQGGSLRICAASAPVRQLLRYTNLTSLLESDGDPNPLP